jgi:hypothetical protein
MGVGVQKPGRDSPELGHRLLLVSTDGSSRELRRFDRHCDTLWSADSSRIAVTDWLGSNLSDVFIYSVTNSRSGISLADLLPKDTLAQTEIRGHCYYEAVKWLDDHRLRIRVFGHTDEFRSHGFEYAYLFDLSSQRFEKVTAKAPNKPDGPNRRQPLGLRAPIGEARVRGLTAAVGHPERSAKETHRDV